MKKLTLVAILLSVVLALQAQIDLSKIVNLDQLLGKVLTVKKGYAPKFSIGNTSIEKIAKVGEIIGLKKNAQATKYFNTFKTGRTVYRVAEFAAAAMAVYSSVKAIDKASATGDYQKPIVAALGTAATGLIVKFLTKQASYKAVDVFNGVIRNKVKDIFSIEPASSNLGIGLYVKF